MMGPSFLLAAMALAGQTGQHDAPPAAAAAPLRCDPDATERKVRVMLMDLEVAPEHARLARTLGQAVADEAQKVRGYELLTSDELRAALDAEAQKALAGCDESGCLAEIAEALDADLLVSGNLDMDETPTLNLSLLNTRALVTMNRVSLVWPGDPALLPDVARAAAQLLMFERGQRKPGSLVLEDLPAGARVVVDEEDRSDDLTRDGVLEEVEVGPRQVRISAEGYESREELVLIRSGKDTYVDGYLEGLPSNWSWWALGGAGALAVVTAAAGIGAVVILTGGANIDTTATANVPTLGNVESIK